MKKNMGNADRIIRILLAIIIGFMWYNHVITGTLAVIALILAIVFVVTSFISFCPLYALFGMSTCPPEKKA